jgi:hypothetical protein
MRFDRVSELRNESGRSYEPSESLQVSGNNARFVRKRFFGQNCRLTCKLATPA